MVGENIRAARQDQHLSLTDVAGRAGISAATLSRIETNKQSLDLGIFLLLARILKRQPHELLGAEGSDTDLPLASKIASLGSNERTRLWRDVSAARRTERGTTRRSDSSANVAMQVEELLAQIDFIREEIEVVRKRLRSRRS
jgi:transcriptional regulator with XRE-family HTH domain